MGTTGSTSSRFRSLGISMIGPRSNTFGPSQAAVLQGNAPSFLGRGDLERRIRLSLPPHRRGHSMVTMHPQVIGRGHRFLLLERFVQYMAGHPGVSFTTPANTFGTGERARSPSSPQTPVRRDRRHGSAA